MLRPVGDDYILRPDALSVEILGVANNRLYQRWNPLGRRVPYIGRRQLRRRAQNRIQRHLALRFPRPEVDHRLAAVTKLSGRLVQQQSWRLLYFSGKFANRHISSFHQHGNGGDIYNVLPRTPARQIIARFRQTLNYRAGGSRIGQSLR